MTHKQAARLALAGGVIVAAGSILPWGTVMSGFGQVEFAGTSGDGMITIVMGAIVALLGFVNLEHPASGAVRGSIVLLGVAAVGLAANVIGNISSLTATEYTRTSAGYGLFLVIIGGVVAVIGAVNMTGRADPIP